MQPHHSVASAAASNCICSEGSGLGIDGPRVLRLQQGAGSSCKERRRWRTGNWQLPTKVVNDVPVGIHSIGGVFPFGWSAPGFKTPALPYALHRPPQKSESQAKQFRRHPCVAAAPIVHKKTPVRALHAGSAADVAPQAVQRSSAVTAAASRAATSRRRFGYAQVGAKYKDVHIALHG
jgi:hypothetical protein